MKRFPLTVPQMFLTLLIWVAANVVAYAGFDLWEKYDLSQQHRIPLFSLYQFQFKTVPMKLTDNSREVELWYRLLCPPGGQTQKKYPVFIFLHGSGSRGSDNVRQLRSLPLLMAQEPYRSQFPCYVLVPQCPEHYSWSSYYQLGGHDKANPKHNPILAMLDDVLNHESADRARVYLCGNSMGGYGCWDLASSVPDRLAAVVPIAGGGDSKHVSSLIRTPLWNVHSTDDTVVPVTQSQAMIQALREAGGQPHYTEYSDAGHSAWIPALKDSDEILTWMFQQTRSSTSHLNSGALP